MTAPISGQFGVVAGRSSTSNWSISKSVQTSAKVASNTKSGTVRRNGPRDWSGEYAALGGIPSVFPGERFTFIGYTGPKEEYSADKAGPVYTGPAIVENVAITINWETGEIISHTVSFAGNGALVQSEETYTDDSAFDAPQAGEARLEIIVPGSGSASGEASELCNIRTLTLTLSATNGTRVDSCSGNWTFRTPGPISWTLNGQVNDADLEDFEIQVGEFYHFRLWIDTERYWDLKWGLTQEFSGLTVDTETADPINFTFNVEMSSHNDVPEDGIGFIRVPGHPDEDWWPKGTFGLEMLHNSDVAHWKLSDSPFDQGTGNTWSYPGDGDNVVFTVDQGGGVQPGFETADAFRMWVEEGRTYRIEAEMGTSGGTLGPEGFNFITWGEGFEPSTVHNLLESTPVEQDWVADFTGYLTFRIVIENTNVGEQLEATFETLSVKPYN